MKKSMMKKVKVKKVKKIQTISVEKEIARKSGMQYRIRLVKTLMEYDYSDITGVLSSQNSQINNLAAAIQDDFMKNGDYIPFLVLRKAVLAIVRYNRKMAEKAAKCE